jgi:hypothetical protein
MSEGIGPADAGRGYLLQGIGKDACRYGDRLEIRVGNRVIKISRDRVALISLPGERFVPTIRAT